MTKKILVVDDQIALLKPWQRPLEAAGYMVEFSEALEEAVSLELEHHFDMFVVDLNLRLADLPPEIRAVLQQFGSFPTNGGQAFMRWVKSQNPKAKHFYITSASSPYQPGFEDDKAPVSQRVIVRDTPRVKPSNIVATMQRLEKTK